MKISLNWIKEFVNLDGVTASDIDKKINEGCAEIEEIEIKGADTENVVFGKILEIENHPESKKLHVLKVDVGTEVLQIVCGAPNVRVGMVTCVAKCGGKVCGHKIAPAKLVGIDSFGMCCSEAELGIGSDDNGICDIDFEVELGKDIKEVLPIDDIVLEIDNKTLTNRPDLWGHYGFAREFAAIFNRPLKPLSVLDLNKFEGLKRVDIKVDTDKCFRYSALTVANVSVKRSPMPMRLRLCYVGMRDINLLADITNYIMLELGQPMHAFDNKIVKDIIVKSSKSGDKLITLENEEHVVPENSIEICDGKKEIVALAGIKGGLKSGITDKTDSVLFESATFDSSTIRKTSRSLGLITDASLRYEKSLDSELTKIALARLLWVLHGVDDNIIVTSCFSDCYNVKPKKVIIDVSLEFVSKRIGVKVSMAEMVRILTALGFSCKDKEDSLQVTVPSFRATKDVGIKEDLVEEIARMIGYGSILAKPLKFEVEPVVANEEHLREYQAKKLLAAKYGATEVHSHIWHFENFCKEHKINLKPVLHLLDTRNAGQSGIRTMLTPTMLKFVSENKEQQAGEVKIFEIGRCVPSLNEQNLANEEKHLAVAFASETKTEEELFSDLKNYLYDFGYNFVGATYTFERGGEIPEFMHSVNTCLVKFRDTELGFIGIVNPQVSSSIGKKLKIAVCELNFHEMINCKDYPKKIRMPSKFQSVHINLNFLVKKEVSYSEFEKLISKIRNKILVNKKLVEVFESEVLKDNKSMLIDFELNGNDHTLTGEEIDEFMNLAIDQMAKNGCPLKQ